MLLKKGDSGSNVTYLQYGLHIMCCNPNGIDGIFGNSVFEAVKKLQSTFNLSIDGIVGDVTWGKLLSEIKAIQTQLNNKGFNVGTADGIAGQNTYNGVLSFQKSNGLTSDGMVGAATKSKLFTGNNIDSSGTSNTGLQKFIEIAKGELSKGFKETNSNNITPYGEWYGMNGEPWCAMFVSWCAYNAGILNNIVPKYAYCPYGVNWYKEHNKYASNSANYIPKPGDTIMFQTNGVIDHTGIIIDFSNNIITTIEGNSSDMVAQRSYPKENSRIHGYGIN